MIVVGAAMTLSVLVTAGCTKADPAPPASPSSTQPPETKIERETRLAFEAAEKAYRTNWAEVARLSAAGGAREPTKVLKETSTGAYLDDAMAELRRLKKEHLRTDQSGKIAWVKSDVFKQSSLTLVACEDYRGVKIIDENSKKSTPENVGTRVYQQYLSATKTPNGWKISDYYTDQVKSCE